MSLVVLSIAVRVRLLGPPSLWFDDAWAALVWKADGVLQAVQVSATAPAFGLLLKFWLTAVGFSEVNAQLLPFLIGVALPPAAYVVSLRLGLTPVGAIVTALVLAGSPGLVEASARVKQYTLDAGVSFAVLAAGWRVVQRPDDRRRWGWLGVAGGLGVLISTPVAIVAAAAVGAGLIAARQAHATMRHAVVPAAIVAGAVLLAWWTIVERFVQPGIQRAFAPNLIPLDSGGSGALIAFRAAARIATAGLPFGVASIVIVAIVAGWLLWRGRTWMWLLGLPFAGAFLAAALQIAPIGTKRTDCYLYPVLALALGLTTSRVVRARAGLVVVAATAVCAALMPFRRAYPAPIEDLAALVPMVEQSAGATDGVLLLRSTSLPFALYTTWPVTLRPAAHPSHPGFVAVIDRPNVATLQGALRQPEAVAAQVRALATGREAVWTVASGADRRYLPTVAGLLDGLGFTAARTEHAPGAEVTRWQRPR